MHDEPDTQTLLAFRDRRLPPETMLRVDRHLAADANTRARLARLVHRGSSALAGPRRERAALQAVIARGQHLSFEQLKAHVDGRLTAPEREQADSHAELCLRCRRELTDLATHAAALRQPIPPAQAAAAAGGWFGGWLRLVPGLAMAGIVGAVALTLMLRAGDPDSGNEGAMRTTAGATAPLAALQHHSLDDLSAVSIDAALAWQARDHARLLAVLRPLASQREPQAMAALASLYALGLGVPQDMRMAEQLWQRAADLGHAEAQANLGVLRRPSTGRP